MALASNGLLVVPALLAFGGLVAVGLYRLGSEK